MSDVKMSEKKKAEMKFKQAMRKEEQGDEAAVTRWLGEAAEHEKNAIANGEGSPSI